MKIKHLSTKWDLKFLWQCFWGALLCKLVKVYQWIGEKYCLHLHGKIISWADSKQATYFCVLCILFSHEVNTFLQSISELLPDYTVLRASVGNNKKQDNCLHVLIFDPEDGGGGVSLKCLLTCTRLHNRHHIPEDNSLYFQTSCRQFSCPCWILKLMT